MITLDLPPLADFEDLDPAVFARSVARAMVRPHPELRALLSRLGAPPVDMLTTLLSARATLLGAERGRAFFHHELRARVPVPEGLEPEVAVWDGTTVPSWQDGVYVEPKYFSFRQDAPFAAYNAVHRRKWRAHEMLHGANGFFWRPDMTRFEFYVGARLNELLPVVHWWALDEMYRPRCSLHAGSSALGTRWCAMCEKEAGRAFWEQEPTPQTHARATELATEAREHYSSELEACVREIETGHPVETFRRRLNASSDAIGYLRGHWNRTTAWSFGAWIEGFLIPGVDYYEDLSDYLQHIRAVATSLVSGSLRLEPKRFEALRLRRIAQDAAYRTLLALEWLEEGSAASRAVEVTVMPVLEHLARVSGDLVHSYEARWGTEEALDQLLEVLGHVRTALPAEVADSLLAFGLSFWPPGRDPDWEAANVREGLTQAMPQTLERVDDAAVGSFVESDDVEGPGRISSRFADHLRALGSPQADLARFEAWAQEDPRRDDDAEHFAAVPSRPEEVEAQRLRFNETFRRAAFSAEALEGIVALPSHSGFVELAGAYFGGALRMMLVDRRLAAVLEAVRAGEVPADFESLVDLIENGIVLWLPRP